MVGTINLIQEWRFTLTTKKDEDERFIPGKPDLQEIRTRNIALLFIERTGFMSLFKEGVRWRANTQFTTGIPDDAVVESMWAAPERDGVMMLLSSPSFEPVIEGAMPPILAVRVDVS